MASERSLLHRVVYHRYEPRTLTAANEPAGDVFAPHHLYVGVALALVGGLLVWPVSVVAGAVLSLVGVVTAADDVVNHALGTTTPLGQLWRRINRKHLR